MQPAAQYSTEQAAGSSADRSAGMTGRLVRHGTRSDNADAACGLRQAARRPASSGRQLGVVFLEKLFLGHVPFGDLGKLDDEIDHLFLIDRRPYGRERIGILLIVIPYVPLAPGILADSLKHPARNFLLGDLDAVLVADFRKDEP